MTHSMETTFASVFKFFGLETKTVTPVCWYKIHLSLKRKLITTALKLALKRHLIHVTGNSSPQISE